VSGIRLDASVSGHWTVASPFKIIKASTAGQADVSTIISGRYIIISFAANKIIVYCPAAPSEGLKTTLDHNAFFTGVTHDVTLSGDCTTVSPLKLAGGQTNPFVAVIGVDELVFTINNVVQDSPMTEGRHKFHIVYQIDNALADYATAYKDQDIPVIRFNSSSKYTNNYNVALEYWDSSYTIYSDGSKVLKHSKLLKVSEHWEVTYDSISTDFSNICIISDNPVYEEYLGGI
jgi:hypothetical protein